MASSIDIERVQETDLEELTNLLHATKLSLSINRLIIKDWPNDPVQQNLYHGALEGALHSEAIEDWKAVDKMTGKIAGYIAYTVKEPKDKNSDVPEGSEGQTPEGVVPEVHDAVMHATDIITKATSDVRRVEIIYTCVDKSYQRQGIGSQLLERCLSKARDLGLPVIVYAEPAARAYYDHHGFEEFAYGDIDLSNFAPPFSGFGVFRLTGMIWNHEER